MLANKAKATNYRILFPLLCTNIPLNLSFLMHGGQLIIQLDVIIVT
jgi:hypothetical protein